MPVNPSSPLPFSPPPTSLSLPTLPVALTAPTYLRRPLLPPPLACHRPLPPTSSSAGYIMSPPSSPPPLWPPPELAWPRHATPVPSANQPPLLHPRRYKSLPRTHLRHPLHAHSLVPHLELDSLSPPPDPLFFLHIGLTLPQPCRCNLATTCKPSPILTTSSFAVSHPEPILLLPYPIPSPSATLPIVRRPPSLATDEASFPDSLAFGTATTRLPEVSSFSQPLLFPFPSTFGRRAVHTSAAPLGRRGSPTSSDPRVSNPPPSASP